MCVCVILCMMCWLVGLSWVVEVGLEAIWSEKPNNSTRIRATFHSTSPHSYQPYHHMRVSIQSSIEGNKKEMVRGKDTGDILGIIYDLEWLTGSMECLGERKRHIELITLIRQSKTHRKQSFAGKSLSQSIHHGYFDSPYRHVTWAEEARDWWEESFQPPQSDSKWEYVFWVIKRVNRCIASLQSYSWISFSRWVDSSKCLSTGHIPNAHQTSPIHAKHQDQLCKGVLLYHRWDRRGRFVNLDQSISAACIHYAPIDVKLVPNKWRARWSNMDRRRPLKFEFILGWWPTNEAFFSACIVPVSQKRSAYCRCASLLSWRESTLFAIGEPQILSVYTSPASALSSPTSRWRISRHDGCY